MRRVIAVVAAASVLVLARAQDHTAPIKVIINPEARVSVSRGAELPQPASCGIPLELPVEILNQGFVTAPLEARVVAPVPETVHLDFAVEPLKGVREERRMLRLTLAKPEPVDLTIAFRTQNNIGDPGGRDRIHFVVRCR